MSEPTPDGTTVTPTAGGRPRLAFLSYSSGEYDARTARMARTALRAGFEVVVYARNQRGLPVVEARDGYVIRRAPWRWWMAVPGLARLGSGTRSARARRAPGTAGGAVFATGGRPAAPPPRTMRRRIEGLLDGTSLHAVSRTVLKFPIRPMGWARALDAIVEPADVWHGMWAGSLPALVRQADRLGGRTIYDSRDVYMESRDFAVAPGLVKRALASSERRWAHKVDRVLTVNDGYATLVARQLRLPMPRVVRNTPERWTPPVPPPDLIRGALGLPTSTAIVLYQGQLISDRGIELAMEAILAVDGAVLVILGFGGLRPVIDAQTRAAPYEGKVFLLPPVPPDALLDWTASADISVMPIAPTSINHRFTTPQKLFESIAVGVPVVASDLPGMSEVVRDADAGLLCDPLSPASIASALRVLVNESPAERLARRGRILATAHDRYAWDTDEAILVALYEELAPRRAGDGSPG